jgi:hypothetical protein
MRRLGVDVFHQGKVKPVHIPWTKFDVVLEDKGIVVFVGGIPGLQGSWERGVEWGYLMTQDQAISGPFSEEFEDVRGCCVRVECYE